MKTCMLQAAVQFMKEARLPCSLIHPLTTHTVLIGELATLLALVLSMAVALGLQGSQDLEVNIMVVVIHAVNHG
jgi:hypothetical protein